MKPTPKWLIASVALLAIAGFIWWRAPDSRMRQADVAIRKVDIFERDHGHLPASLAEVGIAVDESGPIYYQKENDGAYIVWYGLSLGESEVYDSRTHAWSHNS